MGYFNAEEILPTEIIEIIQQYVDGNNIYIPKKKGNKTVWGTKTGIRNELYHRNQMIYTEYIDGESTKNIAEKYYLSQKSIQRIVREFKSIKGER